MADHSNEQQPQGSPTMSAIIKLDTSPPYPISDYTPSDIVSGKPKAGVNSQFMSADKKLSAGLWRSTVGKWGPWDQTEDEVCFVTSGRAIISDKKDKVKFVVKKGDAFVIPKGFSGYWETSEDFSKYFVSYNSIAKL
eukprot:TRINITY_DN3010_c0_g1_i3.p1 TRINITY_DN3010_c0_g1~~TRINITY_DN3010_c0_g1_i3.p1  ORF type:complete len:152 (-),score=30.64 TRINITY_DN3010_c0_g1_i3:43-453(-)